MPACGPALKLFQPSRPPRCLRSAAQLLPSLSSNQTSTASSPHAHLISRALLLSATQCSAPGGRPLLQQACRGLQRVRHSVRTSTHRRGAHGLLCSRRRGACVGGGGEATHARAAPAERGARMSWGALRGLAH